MKTSTRATDVPEARGRGRSDTRAWYRQFWPWFLIALPAASVALSFVALYVAVNGADEVLPHEGDSTSYSAPRAPAPSSGVSDREDEGPAGRAPGRAP